MCTNLDADTLNKLHLPEPDSSCTVITLKYGYYIN